MNDVPEPSGRQHEHSVDVNFAKQGGRDINGRRESDLCCLSKLALMTGFDIPLDVAFETWPPKTVEEGVAC